MERKKGKEEAESRERGLGINGEKKEEKKIRKTREDKEREKL